jgi:hypothetical protein
VIHTVLILSSLWIFHRSYSEQGRQRTYSRILAVGGVLLWADVPDEVHGLAFLAVVACGIREAYRLVGAAVVRTQ